MTRLIIRQVPIFLLLMFSCGKSFCQCSSEELANMRKTALIFGEKSYKYSKPLSNPMNDAYDIADSLKRLGFDINLYCDTDYTSMSQHINAWYSKVDQYDVALFYYSGHGIEYEGENYLLPIDADPKQPSDLHHVAYSANTILSTMESNKNRINIMILDACRDNPLLKSWTKSIGNGLETIHGEGGSFVAYAAGPGKVARDGFRRNGIYTESILKYISKENLSIYDAFTLVNNDVRNKTFGAQIPYVSSSLSKSFCFNPEDKLSFLKTKKSSAIQPESNFLLSPDGNLFFRKDSKNNSLIIQETRNYNQINLKKQSVIYPYKMLAGANNVYIIDTVSNYFYSIDYKKRILKGSIMINNNPIALTVDKKENKAYILSVTSSDKSSISVIDLLQYKKIKSISIKNSIGAVATSIDDNYLYATTSYSSKNKGLYVINLKTTGDSNFVYGISSGQAIGVSHLNGKIYASNINSDGIDHVNIIENSSLKVLNSINFKAVSFNFTSDKKYVLAIGIRDILLIDALKDQYVGKIKLDTKIDGIAIADSNYIFSYLPNEDRIYSFSLEQRVKKDSIENSDYKSKIVQERIKSKNLTDPNYKINEVLAKANDMTFGTVFQLAYQWGPSFEASLPECLGANYKDGTIACYMAIALKSDPAKQIKAFLRIKVDNNYFVMTLEDKEVKESYTSLNRNIEWNKVAEIVKTFFLDRSNQLGL